MVNIISWKMFFSNCTSNQRGVSCCLRSPRETFGVVQLPDFKAQCIYKKGKRAGCHVSSRSILQYRLWITWPQTFAKPDKVKQDKIPILSSKESAFIPITLMSIQNQLLSLHTLLHSWAAMLWSYNHPAHIIKDFLESLTTAFHHHPSTSLSPVSGPEMHKCDFLTSLPSFLLHTFIAWHALLRIFFVSYVRMLWFYYKHTGK